MRCDEIIIINFCYQWHVLFFKATTTLFLNLNIFYNSLGNIRSRANYLCCRMLMDIYYNNKYYYT